MMRRVALVLLVLLAPSCATVVPRTATLRFPSLADGTVVDGYLFRPEGDARRPAVVFLHGCGGLFPTTTGQIVSRELDWSRRFVDMGYAVLMVDSFSPRRITRMCSPQTFQQSVFLERPKDAYGALRYLQAQPFVRPDRIAVVGWSQGGGVTLLSVRGDSLGRPADLREGDFRAAVAFYPSVCNERSHRVPWTSAIPTLVLIGERDNWTLPEPCKQFVEAAAARGSDIRIQIYPGAYHDFDWPNLAIKELPAYRTSNGTVPITGMDPAAREDALRRVTEFLKSRLED
jgi:dienelactone hydrolase